MHFSVLIATIPHQWGFLLILTSSCFVVEMSTLTRENGITSIKILKAVEVEELIKEHEQVKAEEAKQAAAKK